DQKRRSFLWRAGARRFVEYLHSFPTLRRHLGLLASGQPFQLHGPAHRLTRKRAAFQVTTLPHGAGWRVLSCFNATPGTSSSGGDTAARRGRLSSLAWRSGRGPDASGRTFVARKSSESD